MLDRRSFVKLSAELTLLVPFARLGAAAIVADSRFVLVILRGGLDGLAAVPPYGEGRYRSLRGALALDAPGGDGGVLDLDGLFGLHPALQNMHRMYRAGEMSVLHAAATPYRERSHFDGQKVLEAGGVTPSTSAGGWLNRALTAMSESGGKRDAVAIADSVPLVLRGPFVVGGWTPSRLPETDDDTLARITALYEAVDPEMAARLAEALRDREVAGGAGMNEGGAGRGRQVTPLAQAAARLLAAADGPRIAVIDIGGWDTHANQGAADGRLSQRLRALDAGVEAMRTELGPHWASTSVAIVTEFGRTVAVNGTHGTDHGTAGCAMLAGGAVAGGRVVADWPGLAPADLYEARDLRPTLDLRAAFKGLLAERFGLSEAVLESSVFPDSRAAPALEGLTARAP